MARFNFGAGNASKLLRAPLVVLGHLATLLIPRSKDSWVFGSAFGRADGAWALYQRALADGVPATWLSADDKHTLRGFWVTARARVIVITHGFGDVNRYATAGALIVQLWHGIPLKRLGLDSPATAALPPRLAALPGAELARALLRGAYRWSSRRIDVIPAASHLARGRLESAFALRDTAAVVTGEPRVDLLSTGSIDERRNRARDILTAAIGDLRGSVILYAPTWRDGGADPAVPTPVDWAHLTQMLDRADATLVIRSHPLGAGAYTPPGPDPRIVALPAATLTDVLTVLAAVDVLVTDYSSLVFEAGLVDVPVVLLAPDLAEYQARRGLYGRYGDLDLGGWATDWPGTVDRLEQALGPGRPAAITRARTLAARSHAHADGGNTERLYREIRRRMYDGSRTSRRVLRTQPESDGPKLPAHSRRVLRTQPRTAVSPDSVATTASVPFSAGFLEPTLDPVTPDPPEGTP